MQIYVLTSAHNRFDTRIYQRQCRSLSKYFSVSLIVLDGRGNEFSMVQITDLGKRPKNKWLRAIKANILMCIHLYSKKEKTIIHFHDPELFLVGVFSKLLGFKVIYDMHEDLPSQVSGYFPKVFESPIKKIITIIENGFSRIFDSNIAATPFIFDRIRADRKYLVRNFPIYKSDPISFDRENIIIATGLLNNRRGLNVILSALEKLDRDDYKFIVVGSVSPSFAIKKYKEVLGERFKHIPYMPHKELMKLLGRSKIGLAIYQDHPNHTFSVPNKIFEYMERGVTVIAGNIDSWSSYISNGETGIFVIKEDSCELAAKISELLNNEKLQRKIGLKAHQVVASKFNWQYEHEQLICCYNILKKDENSNVY